MGPYISLSSEISGRALIGAWALKGMNMVITTEFFLFIFISLILCHVIIHHFVTKQTIWPVLPAKTQISLGIHPVLSESLLCSL